MFTFENSFQTLPPIFFSEVVPTPLTNPRLVALSRSCQDLLELNLSKKDLVQWLNGNIRLPGDQRISTRYAGHQFGVWAGQLGDGRAISLGELIVKTTRYEIQSKGAGLTPFSRMGDGKAVIRSSLREFLCSEHMHALGVPTTRALACLIGDDPVERETIERSGLIARVFPSNLRFGHFEYAFHFDKPKELQALVDYTRETFFPECKSTPEMLREISRTTAQLMAQWMGLGFCHGVMNTDNMSILGLTIDYGPFGFMDDFNKNWICNHSDPHGRYKYSNQPSVGLWNLDRLLWTFSDLLPREELQTIFDSFMPDYEKFHQQIMQKKLGLATWRPEDKNLMTDLLQLMHKYALDFTYVFRNLNTDLEAYPLLKKYPDWQAWQKQYSLRIQSEHLTPELWRHRLHQQNPKFVLKNYIAQEIIEHIENANPLAVAEVQDAFLEGWMQVLTDPFSEHPAFQSYSLPTPADKKDLVVSCSS